MDYLMHTYQRLPISFEHGEGVYLFDKAGNRYLDALSGIAVTGLGHNHPKITQAITEQAGKLLHTSNLYQIDNQNTLEEKLAELTGLQKSYICNSGVEAVEAELQLTRLYIHVK